MGIRNEIVKQILKLAGQVRREMDITPFDVVFLTIRISLVIFSHLIASFH